MFQCGSLHAFYMKLLRAHLFKNALNFFFKQLTWWVGRSTHENKRNCA